MTLAREGCLTCGDVAVAARVVEVDGRDALVTVGGEPELDALVTVGGEPERVALDLVPDATPGDLLLCHAGIALERIEEER